LEPFPTQPIRPGWESGHGRQRAKTFRRIALALGLLGAGLHVDAAGPSWGQDTSIVLASTTSPKNSGLFGHILPMFKAKTGIDVKVAALGTGQALDAGRRGNADVVFVHAKAQEEQFVAEGFGVKRYDVMYNDFVLIGPSADPAGIKGGKDVLVALKTIYVARGSLLVSRGDRSGTHAAELALWKAAALDPARAKPAWYREIGQDIWRKVGGNRKWRYLRLELSKPNPAVRSRRRRQRQ
jgi:tungstate transport system substrate-binding protein